MSTTLPMRTKFATLMGTAIAVAMSAGSAQALNIADSPLFLTGSAEPLIMLTLSNDEQLYHKAYTDFDDVDGDTLIDVGYKDTIDYSGYFDAKKCYRYNSGAFEPMAAAAGTNGHHCSSVATGRWSGNFLNWVSMTRMDVLRQVLYGGYRVTDGTTTTVLERAYVPPDNHAWIKLYRNSDLNEYTPYSISTYAAGITMCNVTPQAGSATYSETNVTRPRLRVAAGAWTEWAAQESNQCLWTSEFGSAFSPSDATNKIDEFDVRIKVCDSSLLGSEPCKQYPNGNYKPTGLLQDYADADKLAIRFGLMTGSYAKRKSGGVLRKNVGRLVDLVTAANGEINPASGQFTATNGLIRSLDAMRLSRFQYGGAGYGGGGADNCPFNQNTWVDGNCSNWGNPMGEMYLETLRYFSGASANSGFTADDSGRVPGVTGSVPGPLNTGSWFNPYSNTSQPGGKAPHCSKPNVIAISTGVVSFDHDQYGGASDITGLNVNAETDAVGASEGVNGRDWYVGSLTGGSPNDVCTPRTVNALSAVSGICPEAAGLQGSFKIAGLASFVHKSTSSLQTVGTKKIPPVDTYTVALAPPTPSIKVPIGATTVTIIPVGYNMRNSNAMSMVNFRVISQAADGSSGEFFMNYENAPAGADYDNDMKGFLRYAVTGNTIKIIMHQTGSSSGATQNMGYIIDGVSDANTHYLLSNNDLTITAPGNQTPAAGGTFTTDIASIDTRCAAAGFADPASVADQLCFYDKVQSATDTKVRYMRGIRTHTVGTAATGLLKSPLWYAAKWGGYKDANKDGIPQTAEWDANNDGNPDTYFPVTNAGKLKDQLKSAFNEIIDRTASASSASVNSGSISDESRVYQARFNSVGWVGELLAFKINSDGTLDSTEEWNAALKMPAHADRSIFTLSSAGTGTPFTWTAISADATRKGQLDATDAQAELILNYVRGDGSNEQSATNGTFRNRATKLGDIISSSPLFVGESPFRYRDTLEGTAPAASYFAFRDAQLDRTQVVYVGANDGMLHAFNAEDTAAGGAEGTEMFAYIPGAVFKNLKLLSNPAYAHRYYVDGSPNMGDVFYNSAWHTVLVGGLNKGGQAIYALDITDPDSFSASKVLWEFNDVGAGNAGDKGDTDLGYTYSRPAIVRLNNNRWAAVFGNGYNNSENDGATNTSTTGRAALYVVDIEDGTLIKKISVPGGSTSTPNGLATPAAVDFDGDVDVDYVYAGDLLGNLWKFDLTDADPDNWDVAYTPSGVATPLYVARDDSNNRQPITSRPEVGRGPNGNGMVVLFGTGKFLEDPADKQLTPRRDQSFYGIYDSNSGAATDAFTGRTALAEQTIVAEPTLTISDGDFDGVDEGAADDRVVTLRVTSDTAPLARGWYMDLVSPPDNYQGERVVSNPLLRNNRVIFTTVIPDTDPCGYGGNSWLMELDALTGQRLPESPFDLNRDGQFTEADFAPGSPSVPPSGMMSEVGITPEPGVLTDAVRGLEYKYMPGTTGNIQMIGENPGVGNVGRQSWRQIR